MPTNLIAAGFAATLVAIATAALYYWRRSSSLYALLVEGANRFEELRQRNQQLEQLVQKTEERAKLQRESNQSVEKSLVEARAKAADLVKQLEGKDHERHVVTEKLELQKSFLEKQLAKAEQRIAQAEAERTTAEATLNERIQAAEASATQRIQKAKNEAMLLAEAARQDLGLRERELTQRLRDLEKDHAVLQKKLRDADPVEMRKIKRRIAQYERLYQSMKGLREMTDERNRNYEVALGKLSAWIVRATGSGNVPQQLGPLVGTALQAIGAQLIDEQEATPAAVSPRIHEIPTRGASRAESMDLEDVSLEGGLSDEALADEEAALAAEHETAAAFSSKLDASALDSSKVTTAPLPVDGVAIAVPANNRTTES